MGVFSGEANDHCSNDSAVVHRRSRELGALPLPVLGAPPPPRAGEGWGGGELARVLLRGPPPSPPPPRGGGRRGGRGGLLINTPAGCFTTEVGVGSGRRRTGERTVEIQSP